MTQKKAKKGKDRQAGKLRIGDNWNAITIIALSQNNPLKAVAEFVENSIDAQSKRITITRGKEKGIPFLRIKDDGQGIRQDGNGIPDFHYVATHICDSIKRQLKLQGTEGLQGEFGIGLLSFWTVGEELAIVSCGSDGKTYQMQMTKGDPNYRVTHRRLLISEPGTELTIRKILPGIKQFSGEKIQWYLASELRDRIRNSKVDIQVIDRTSRTSHKVEPRKFEGRLLHELPQIIVDQKRIYLEIYLTRPDPNNAVELFRSGTRVIQSISQLTPFAKPPWTSGYLQGIIDAQNLNLTPGTRTGVIFDEALSNFSKNLEPLEHALVKKIEEQQRAEEEKTSRDVLRSIQKALKEALLALPEEEYDWFNIRAGSGRNRPTNSTEKEGETAFLNEDPPEGSYDAKEDRAGQKQFFEFAGPLHNLRISPASSVVAVNRSKNLRAVPRDRSGHAVEENISFNWELIEGDGKVENVGTEIVTFVAPTEPGLIRLKVTAKQMEITCEAEALITVTESLLPEDRDRESTRQGIPNYTYQKAPGELWRSRFQSDSNVIVINNGHRDFVYASRNKALKLRYICRLFAKELVLKNFPGASANDLLERLIELSLYTEENLR